MSIFKTKKEGEAFLRKMREEGCAWLTLTPHDTPKRIKFEPAEKITNIPSLDVGWPWPKELFVAVKRNGLLTLVVKEDAGSRVIDLETGYKFRAKIIPAIATEIHNR